MHTLTGRGARCVHTGAAGAGGGRLVRGTGAALSRRPLLAAASEGRDPSQGRLRTLQPSLTFLWPRSSDRPRAKAASTHRRLAARGKGSRPGAGRLLSGKSGDGGVRRWPCPHSALEMVPKLTEQCQAPSPAETDPRPLCKHHPEKGEGGGAVLGSSPSSRFIFLNKIIARP